MTNVKHPKQMTKHNAVLEIWNESIALGHEWEWIEGLP